jgi:O-antigen ligase
MAAETGIVGLVALLVFLRAPFVSLLRGAKRARLDARISPDEARLRRALLWSFAVALTVCLVEWPFAHGIGQLLILVAAAGFALEGAAGAEGP